MRTRSVILAFIISLGLVLALTATSLATTIDFSGSTSDDTLPSALKALVEYDLDTSLDPMGQMGTLTIKVTNLSADYTISELYFNISSDISQRDIFLTTPGPLGPDGNGKAKLKAKSPEEGDPPNTAYGSYVVFLDFYESKQHPEYNLSGIGPNGGYYEFVMDVYADLVNNPDATVDLDDFFVPSSPAAVLYFSQGPQDDYAFAAPVGYGSSSSTAPEPATILLLGSGLVGLVGLGRKKRFIEE